MPSLPLTTSWLCNKDLSVKESIDKTCVMMDHIYCKTTSVRKLFNFADFPEDLLFLQSEIRSEMDDTTQAMAETVSNRVGDRWATVWDLLETV